MNHYAAHLILTQLYISKKNKIKNLTVALHEFHFISYYSPFQLPWNP